VPEQGHWTWDYRAMTFRLCHRRGRFLKRNPSLAMSIQSSFSTLFKPKVLGRFALLASTSLHYDELGRILVGLVGDYGMIKDAFRKSPN